MDTTRLADYFRKFFTHAPTLPGERRTCARRDDASRENVFLARLVTFVAILNAMLAVAIGGGAFAEEPGTVIPLSSSLSYNKPANIINSPPPAQESWVWISGGTGEVLTSATDEPAPQPLLAVPPLVEPLDDGSPPIGSGRTFQETAPDSHTFEMDSLAASAPTGLSIAESPSLAACCVPGGPVRRILGGAVSRLQSAGKWEPWIERPGSAGIFLGYAWGTELVDNWLEERDGWWGGVRLGWDWHPHYGVETRLSVGSIDLWDHPSAVAAAQTQGLSTSRDRWARSVVWDVGLLYFASKDDPWQPYIYWGVGITHIDFTDIVGTSYEGTYFTMPLALGLKFRPVSGPVFRFEFADQIIFPSRFNVTHQFSATIGMEMRFGKKRRLYWPWEPAWP
ncbi:MAG: hypothetical protein H5U08_08135 [Thermogutta sp.]|uniref:hypothetical protein n=1 Tax=Thermogutta sp. TaxID=1962930 RepID=UPI001997507A|nr:hypothetical protein [Thermogutta sp.]MBC7352311.1 hypothetical protein [Thermogutta sp.]